MFTHAQNVISTRDPFDNNEIQIQTETCVILHTILCLLTVCSSLHLHVFACKVCGTACNVQVMLELYMHVISQSL